MKKKEKLKKAINLGMPIESFEVNNFDTTITPISEILPARLIKNLGSPNGVGRMQCKRIGQNQWVGGCWYIGYYCWDGNWSCYVNVTDCKGSLSATVSHSF